MDDQRNRPSPFRFASLFAGVVLVAGLFGIPFMGWLVARHPQKAPVPQPEDAMQSFGRLERALRDGGATLPIAAINDEGQHWKVITVEGIGPGDKQPVGRPRIESWRVHKETLAATKVPETIP